MSSEISDETAFPRASNRARAMEMVGKGDGWEALEKAVSDETEPRGVAEPNFWVEALNLTPLPRSPWRAAAT